MGAETLAKFEATCRPLYYNCVHVTVNAGLTYYFVPAFDGRSSMTSLPIMVRNYTIFMGSFAFGPSRGNYYVLTPFRLQTSKGSRGCIMFLLFCDSCTSIFLFFQCKLVEVFFNDFHSSVPHTVMGNPLSAGGFLACR